MIAATITALSRLTWEYHRKLDATTRDNVMDTALMFLDSNNREIVRAVLGYVKVIVVVIPKPTLEANNRIENILKGCMVWSKENKGRLRQKVRGILERVLRRWDGNLVEKWVSDEESRKMVKNVRKRKERAKRNKKAGSGDYVDADDEDADAVDNTRKYDNEFDEAVYGSDDSDADSDDDSLLGEANNQTKAKGNHKSKKPATGANQAYIRANDSSDDEPLDLLDPKSLGSITSRKLGRLRAEASAARPRSKARTNEDGKLIFGNDDNDVLMNNEPSANGTGTSENAGGVDAYLAAVSGPDAIRRGQKGKLKVKSAQRQQPDSMELDEDDARAVAGHLSKKQNGKRPGSSGSVGSVGNGKTQGGKSDPKHARRGLGVEKRRDGGGGGGKHGGKGFGGSKRKVSFGNGQGNGHRRR